MPSRRPAKASARPPPAPAQRRSAPPDTPSPAGRRPSAAWPPTRTRARGACNVRTCKATPPVSPRPSLPPGPLAAANPRPPARRGNHSREATATRPRPLAPGKQPQRQARREDPAGRHPSLPAAGASRRAERPARGRPRGRPDPPGRVELDEGDVAIGQAAVEVIIAQLQHVGSAGGPGRDGEEQREEQRRHETQLRAVRREAAAAAFAFPGGRLSAGLKRKRKTRPLRRRAGSTVWQPPIGPSVSARAGLLSSPGDGSARPCPPPLALWFAQALWREGGSARSARAGEGARRETATGGGRVPRGRLGHRRSPGAEPSLPPQPPGRSGAGGTREGAEGGRPPPAQGGRGRAAAARFRGESG